MNQTKAKTSPSRTFRGGGFLSPVKGRGRWAKLCLEAALGPAAALCRASRGDVLQDEALRAVALRALQEAVAVANKCGERLGRRRMSREMLAACRRPGARRRAEYLSQVEKTLAPLLAAAKKNGTPVPILSRLLRLSRRLEAGL
ncbi:MAG TPA: ketopantoate reductase C-terminal domain-containing protein [Elusimicrobiota bacterium]|nr:ketopantoate reductase C-terminal domain-containing protein [Elusimicrobiota bacterium]